MMALRNQAIAAGKTNSTETFERGAGAVASRTLSIPTALPALLRRDGGPP